MKNKGQVNVQLFNLSGKLVKDVFNDVLYKGVNTIELDASELSKGMYMVVVSSQNQKQSLKIVKR